MWRRAARAAAAGRLGALGRPGAAARAAARAGAAAARAPRAGMAAAAAAAGRAGGRNRRARQRARLEAERAAAHEAAAGGGEGGEHEHHRREQGKKEERKTRAEEERRATPQEYAAAAAFSAALAAAFVWREELAGAANTTTRTARALINLAMIAGDYKLVKYLGVDEEAGRTFEAAHRRSAERLLRLFQKNRGLYIKVGQYLSSMNHVLPAVFPETLKVLQDQAPVMDWGTAEAVLVEELEGRPVGAVFSSFNRTPIAAASLAQVHEAVLRDSGERVAVKIQHPTLRGDFDGDMWCHQFALRAAAYLFEEFNLEWMHDELEHNLRKELDFENEARNAEQCAKNLAGLPRVHVPRVHWAYTRKRVLTMEFIDGVKVTDREGLAGIGAPVPAVTETLLRAISRQIFVHGHVHSDPHVGNFFVDRGEGGPDQWRLVVLDHGLYRDVSEETRLAYCNLWKALVLRRDDDVRACTVALGVEERHWELLALAVLMRPYSGGRVGLGGLTSTREKKAARRKVARNIGDLFAMMEQMPRELLLILRCQNYLRAINNELGVPVNRFKLMARVAAEGVDHVNEGAPHRPRAEGGAAQLQVARPRRGLFVRLADRLSFEMGLRFHELWFWVVRCWFQLAHADSWRRLRQREAEQRRALLADQNQFIARPGDLEHDGPALSP